MERDTTVRELIEFFETTQSRQIPFKNTQMVTAVKNATLQRQHDLLGKLSESMERGYVRLNPDRPRETMIKNAHETFLTLAYLADHSPDSAEEWEKLGPEKAYADEQHYGRAMNLAKKIYDSKQIDVKKVLKRKVS